ncbi:hypothetical protein HanRHA438_Chr03g0120391 [Helianthus annuus]|uniref:Uncharacterized protein n=1 Tax=Helianthus annuus TaxID=4232 RepID=A0A9K3NV11_HELAN|nr:hypothetical protein HanXRQr2_Chr03g0109621 [Helianthus annuus]KAJ0592954.1 hypothetical protein HanHA300_Chr03g0091611 [Helianthus annuus]KAJ0607957.1 hypothetical protein HanHA89_Chr03g0103251 [Helianthus annuus]KAJ0768023.1 hypothetical protein HanLR1_Chr03g0096641 [Helianthus annuus]KAJ0935513.1 hypothetical protein HanRHA438_Chr03g0120391 [Helianthus annuus]
MLQRVQSLRDENEWLVSELKTSQTVAAELRCWVVSAEWELLEREGKERAWEKERAEWMAEWERLLEDVKHFKEAASSLEFKGSLERVYKAYRDVGYQVGLKDGYSFSSQGMKRKDTPHYNSKAKKQLAKLDEEISGQTPALLVKIDDNPLLSLDELKSLFDSTDPVSDDSPSGDGYP